MRLYLTCVVLYTSYITLDIRDIKSGFSTLPLSQPQSENTPSFSRCDNGECFPNNYICDGYNDCSDWEDELPPVCPCQKEKQFACKNGKQCINIHAVCDQHIDCKDGSDEDKSACP